MNCWNGYVRALCALAVVGWFGTGCSEDKSHSTQTEGNSATSNGTILEGTGTGSNTGSGTSSSNETTATSNGTTSTSNGTTATSNGTTATGNGNGCSPACQGQEVCDAQTGECVPQDQEQICAPGETSCLDASQLLTCNPEGTGRTLTACESSDGTVVSMCVSDPEARCVEQEQICIPNEVYCDPSTRLSDGTYTTLRRCDSTGTVLSVDNCGDRGEICAPEFFGHYCAPQICRPWQRRCPSPEEFISTAAVVAQCNEFGTEETTFICAREEICVAGMCQQPICVPEETRTCIDDAVHTCDALGAGFVLTEPCPFGCEGDACRAHGCGNGRIDDGEACDDGNEVTETACNYGAETCMGCTADCQESIALIGGWCGDENIDIGHEQCDGAIACNDDCSWFPCEQTQSCLANRLLPTSHNTGGTFGSTVALSGDVLVVGESSTDVNGLRDSGLVRVYRRNPSGWSLEQTLFSPSPREDGFFGSHAAVEDDVIAVGDSHNGENGAIQMYRHDGQSWNHEATLRPSAPQNRTVFGAQVALSGAWAVVGSSRSNTAHLFFYDGTQWSETQTILSAQGASYGRRVAISGTTMVIADPLDGTHASEAGALYVYELNDADQQWTQIDLIYPEVPAGARIGDALALDGDTMVAGSKTEDDERGAVYVWMRTDEAWHHTQRIQPALALEQAQFGAALDLEGTRLVVGAPLPFQGRGDVHVLDYDGTAWSHTRTLEPHSDASIGSSVTFDSGLIVVRASPFWGTFGNPQDGEIRTWTTALFMFE